MPNLFPFHIEWIQAFLLVFTRVASMLAFMPVIGGQAIPNQMKVGLAVMTSIIFFPLVNHDSVSVDISIFTLGLLIVGEVIIGLLTAFLVNLIFAAVQLAGMTLGFQIGFAITNVVDPLTNAQVSVMGQLLNITAMLIFLAVNAHHLLLMGLADSFSIAPIGGFNMDPGLGEIIIRAWGAVYSTAMQIAAPVTVILLLKQVAMGLIARTVPQMNIFIVGFPITIVLGLVTLAVSLPVFSRLLIMLYSEIPAQMTQVYMGFR